MAHSSRKDGLAGEIGKRGTFASLSQEAYLNLVRTHSQLAIQFARLFKQHGISDPQYNALRILQGEKRPLQIYEIAERMVTPQTDISRLVERLAQQGLVTRKQCDEDRRVVWIELANEGNALLKRLKRPVETLHRNQFQALSAEELVELNRLLVRARRSGE